MKRLPDWVDRLNAYIDLCRNRGHDWVGFNCGVYAAGAVMALTGADPLKDLGVDFDNERDVKEFLIRGGGMRAICDRYFGNSVAPLHARRGDIVLLNSGREDGDEVTGVCVGDHVLVLTDAGLERRELADVIHAYRVG